MELVTTRGFGMLLGILGPDDDSLDVGTGQETHIVTIPTRSHTSRHATTTHHIGAGLVRINCTVCDHVSLEDGSEDFVVHALNMPEWMQAAADRFASFVHPDPWHAAA